MSMDLNWIKNRQARPRSRLLLLVLGTSGSLLMLGGLMGAGASGSHVAAPTIHAQVTHSAAPAAAVAHAQSAPARGNHRDDPRPCRGRASLKRSMLRLPFTACTMLRR